MSENSKFIQLFGFNGEVQNGMSELIRSVREISEGIGRQMKEIVKEIDFESFVEIGKALKEVADDLMKFKLIIIELGYPPHNEFPIPLIRMIVQDYEEHGLEFVKKYLDDEMIEVYNTEFMDALLQKWESFHLSSKRFPILRDVIKCHKQKLFNAAIPTIFPQIEGVIVDVFEHKGKFNGQHQSIYLKHLLLKPEVNDESSLNWEKVLHDFYIAYILVQFEHGKEINSEISRHAILHGGYIEYGSEANSLKLILQYDYLLDCLMDIKEDTIVLAKLEIEELRKRKRKSN